MQLWDTDLETVRRLGPRRIALFAEAFLLLAASRLAVAVLPFRRLAPMLGKPRPGKAGRVQECNQSTIQTVRELAWALRAATRRVPVDALCLTQALAGRMMLRRRGIAGTIRLGLAQGLQGKDTADPGLVAAHAWLEAGGVKVTGYPLDPELVEVAAFD